MDWLNDPAVQEAEAFLKRGVTSDGVIPQQDILSYARAVAVATILEIKAAPTDHIRKQMMTRMLAELGGAE